MVAFAMRSIWNGRGTRGRAARPPRPILEPLRPEVYGKPHKPYTDRELKVEAMQKVIAIIAALIFGPAGLILAFYGLMELFAVAMMLRDGAIPQGFAPALKRATKSEEFWLHVVSALYLSCGRLILAAIIFLPLRAYFQAVFRKPGTPPTSA